MRINSLGECYWGTKIKRRIFLALFTIFFSNSSLATLILTFDDTVPGFVADGYGGLNWDNFRLYPLNTCGGGYCNQGHSGNWFVYNSSGDPASISGIQFDFYGAYFGAAHNNGLNINVIGSNSDVVKYIKTIIVDTTSSNWFDFNFYGIDKLQFSAFGGIDAGLIGSGTQFALDDFTFDFSAASVPEPPTAYIFLFGLFIIGWLNMACDRNMLKRP